MHDGVSRETLGREAAERLTAFVKLLLRWNAAINLLSRADAQHVWQRHVEDSLQVVPLVGGVKRGLDLGSGAGFPGLVVAIATGIPFTLVEADGRKAAFLREAIRVTGAPALVQTCRIERLEVDAASLVTARALAPLPQLLQWSARHLAPDGFCLFHKGANAEQELTAARAKWHMRVDRVCSRIAAGSCILRISEIKRGRSCDQPA